MKTAMARQDGRLPSFQDYRRTNDPGMIPDRGFRKQLKALDKTLEVVWDWGANKWEIWCFPEGERLPYHVTTVQTKNRSYRELGADILVSLQQSMQLGYDNIIKYLDEHNNQIIRRKRQEFLDKISWATRDNWSTIRSIKGRPIEKLFGAEFLNTVPILKKREIPVLTAPLANRIIGATTDA
jgi:hypothetical protein